MMDAQRFTAATAALIAAVLLLIYAKSILMPFVIAIMSAYLLTAFSDRIQRVLPAGFPRWVGHLAAALVLGAGVVVILQVLALSLNEIAAVAPVYKKNLMLLADDGARSFGLQQLPSLDWLLSRTIEQFNMQALLGTLVDSITSVVGNTFLILLYILFLLMERGSIVQKWLLIHKSDEVRRRHDATISEIGTRIRQYVFLKTLVSFLVGVGSWLAMEAIGIDFASFWALLIFALNFIPYIGSPIAVTFPVLLSLLQFGDAATVLVTAVVLTAIQVLVGNFIEPRLMGRSLNLSPVVILLALAAWGSLWGPVGALLSVPIMVILTIVLSQFPITRPVAILLSRDGRV